MGASTAPPYVLRDTRHLHSKMTPQPGGSTLSISTTTPTGSFTSRAHLVALVVLRASEAFQSFCCCAVSWRSVPGSFGRVLAVPAPICEIVHRCAMHWRSVPGRFGRLLAIPAPICEIVCCCFLTWRNVPGSFGFCFGFCGIRFGDPPTSCRISRHQNYWLYRRAGHCFGFDGIG